MSSAEEQPRYEPPILVKWCQELNAPPEFIDFPGRDISIPIPPGCVEVIDRDLAEKLIKAPGDPEGHVGVILLPQGDVWGELTIDPEGNFKVMPIDVLPVDRYVAHRMEAHKITSEPLLREMKIVSEKLGKNPRLLGCGPEGQIVGRPHYYKFPQPLQR